MKHTRTPSGQLAVQLLISGGLLAANEWTLWCYRGEDGAGWLALFLALCMLWSVWKMVRARSMPALRSQGDKAAIFQGMILLWMVLVLVLKLGDPILYPPPTLVMGLLVKEFPRFLVNFRHSILLLAISFSLGLVTAFPLGLLLAASSRLRSALDSYIKILSLVSPIAYIPYIIGIMPTFRAASIFVVYTGTFWPILKWTIYGALHFSGDYILTAKLLRVGGWRYYTRVLIPGIMPEVLSGVSQSLSGGFAVLVAAEMIGSREGLGFIIKYFADFLNYHQVIVGILYLGLSVCLVTGLFERIQRSILSWQVKERKRFRWSFSGNMPG